jgi:hypothetical protein
MKSQRLCHAEQREAFQSESQSEPEKQLESWALCFVLDSLSSCFSSPLRKNLMKTTQSPAPDEKNSFAKANSNSFSSLSQPFLPACRQGRLVFC